MVTAVNLTSGSSGSPATSAVTASVSPTANRYVFVSVNSRNFTGTPPVVPTISGCGLTWTALDNIQYDTGTPSLKRGSVFMGIAASPTPGTITIDFGSDSQTDICWSVDEWVGAPTGSIAVQTAKAKDESGSALSITATLAAFSNAGNATFGAFFHVAPTNGATASPGSGFTALASPTDATIGLITQYKTTNDTTVDGSISGVSYELGMIAVEIAAAATGVTCAAAITEAGDAISSTATVAVSASGTRTEANDTGAATSTVGVVASLARTEAADTLAATIALPIVVAAAATEAADSLASTATAAVVAAAAKTEAPDTGSATAGVGVVAGATTTEAPDTLAATLVGAGFTLAVTEAPDTLSATAQVRVAGAAGISEAPDVGAAAAGVIVGASLARTEAADTLAATATVRVQAGGSTTEAGDTLASTVNVAPAVRVVSLAVTELPDTLAASTTSAIAAAAAIVEAADQLSAITVAAVLAALSKTEAPDLISSTVLVGEQFYAGNDAVFLVPARQHVATVSARSRAWVASER